MWTTGGRRPEAALQRGLHPDDPPPHPDLLAAAYVQAGARMLPAPVLRMFGELGADLGDRAAAGDGDDLVLVVLEPAPALHGQVATATGDAHVRDLCGELGGQDRAPVRSGRGATGRAVSRWLGLAGGGGAVWDHRFLLGWLTVGGGVAG